MAASGENRSVEFRASVSFKGYFSIKQWKEIPCCSLADRWADFVSCGRLTLAGLIDYCIYVTQLGDHAKDGARVICRRPYREAITECLLFVDGIKEHRIRRFGIVFRYGQNRRMVENRRPFIRANRMRNTGAADNSNYRSDQYHHRPKVRNLDDYWLLFLGVWVEFRPVEIATHSGRSFNDLKPPVT